MGHTALASAPLPLSVNPEADQKEPAQTAAVSAPVESSVAAKPVLYEGVIPFAMGLAFGPNHEKAGTDFAKLSLAYLDSKVLPHAELFDSAISEAKFKAPEPAAHEEIMRTHLAERYDWLKSTMA